MASLSCSAGELPTWSSSASTPAIPPTPKEYGYSVTARYPHDPQAFTQGLVYDGGVLYEGTGRVGLSSLRRVDLTTGKVEQRVEVPPPFFGEGVAVLGDRIYQLTWQSKVGFVYDRDTFECVQRFSYETEGWGLTSDGQNLVMSDGTRTLRYLDPNTLKLVRQVQVVGEPGFIISLRLNELEYVKGEIYANVWPTDFIVRIDAASGRVTGWVDLGGILEEAQGQGVDVLNGIAYDSLNDRLFVTGKLWPKLFEIRLLSGN